MWRSLLLTRSPNSTQLDSPPLLLTPLSLSRSLALSLTLGHCDCVRHGWGRDIVGAINLRDRNEYFIAYFRFTH